MGCYWIIDGNVTVPQCKKADLIEIMEDFGIDLKFLCEHKDGMSSFIFSFYEEMGYSFPDYVAEAIAPLATDGVMEVKNDDEESFSLYQFDNGKFKVVNGEQFIYYPGDEENFVDLLPKEVIEVVIKRYLKEKFHGEHHEKIN